MHSLHNLIPHGPDNKQMLAAFLGTKFVLECVQGHRCHTLAAIVIEATDRVILLQYIPNVNACDSYAFIL